MWKKLLKDELVAFALTNLFLIIVLVTGCMVSESFQLPAYLCCLLVLFHFTAFTSSNCS